MFEDMAPCSSDSCSSAEVERIFRTGWISVACGQNVPEAGDLFPVRIAGQSLLVLRDDAGLVYAEIAAILDLPPGTVRSRIARGRARLADAIAGNQNAPGERPSPE